MKTRNQKHVPGIPYIPTLAEQKHEHNLREQRIIRSARVARVASEREARHIISLCTRMDIGYAIRTRKLEAYVRVVQLEL